jgi:tellurite resistance protein TerC
MLGLDLGVFHRRDHAVRVRQALLWTLIWIVLALLFNGVIYVWFGADRALEFLTGYLLEKALLYPSTPLSL